MNDRDKLTARKSLAGTVGGVRRAQVLSPERRREIAMLGVQARLEKGKRTMASQVPAPVVTRQVTEAASAITSDGSRLPRSPEHAEIRIRPLSGPAT
jgi:hypothetical protein